MNIVLEGPDNSGKSTLAKKLSEALKRPVYASEGPEHHKGEMVARVARYMQLDNVIFDRHPCISDVIYGIFRETRSTLAGEIEAEFYYTNPLLIYVEPLERGLQGHVEKAHDNAAHLDLVDKNYYAILKLYRRWAVHRAHFIYRIGDDPERIIRLCRNFDPVGDVKRFHRRFQRNYEGPPRALPNEMHQFGERFMRQELQEYLDKAEQLSALLEDWSDAHVSPDRAAVTELLSEMMDGLLDLMFVVIGRMEWHGFNVYEGWERVMRANMMKRLAKSRAESERGSLLDIVKPEGFVPPSHQDLVSNHIHGLDQAK